MVVIADCILSQVIGRSGIQSFPTKLMWLRLYHVLIWIFLGIVRDVLCFQLWVHWGRLWSILADIYPLPSRFTNHKLFIFQCLREVYRKYKEVFVKHEKAPNSPEGSIECFVFIMFRKLTTCEYFGQYRSLCGGRIRRKLSKGTSRTFIWTYNQVSMTFRLKALARTSSYVEKPVFLDILAKFGQCRWPNLTFQKF